MIRFQRRAVPRISKYRQAMEWAQALAKYMKDSHGVDFRIYVESEGTIHWIADYPSYESYGKVRMATQKDSDYWNYISRASDLFVEGSIQDTVLSAVE